MKRVPEPGPSPLASRDPGPARCLPPRRGAGPERSGPGVSGPGAGGTGVGGPGGTATDGPADSRQLQQTPPQPGAPTRRAAVQAGRLGTIAGPASSAPGHFGRGSGDAPGAARSDQAPGEARTRGAAGAHAQRHSSPMPTPGNNYAGIDNPNGYYPRHQRRRGTARVRADRQRVVRRLRKDTGQALYGPVNNNTLWGGFGGSCQLNNDGDPIVQYDGLANRWLISQFAVSGTSEPDAPVGAQGTFNPETFGASQSRRRRIR